MERSLIFQESPVVTLGTNKFINVPVILKYEDTNLIEVIKEEHLGFTTQIPIFHQDGTYLAKAKGNRLYPTKEGKKANLKIEKHRGLWVCTMDNKTLFEIQQHEGNAFKTTAELHTPDGYFIKCQESSFPILINASGNEINIGGIIMRGSTFSGVSIGIWLKKNGSCSIGTNS